ncbi:MAG: type I pullulanase [Erysipelotrichales bacterium]|nr:type I pullulanase [Erysipelotrichales bacterium]
MKISWKKIICFVLAGFLAFNMAACSPKEPAGQAYPDRDLDLPTKMEPLGEDAVAIHYERADNSFSGWALWLWDPEGEDDGLEDEWNYQDDYGVIAYYPLSKFGSLSGNRLGIIVKSKGSWSSKDGVDADRFIEFNKLTKDADNVYHVYLSSGDAHIYLSPDKVISDSVNQAMFRDEHTIYISASNPMESYKLYENGTLVHEGKGAGRGSFSDKLDLTANLAASYTVDVEFRGSGEVISAPVSMTGLYNSDMFNDQYYYDGELGALWSEKETVFRVWSPVSERIELRIYDNGTPVHVSSSLGSDQYTAYEMNRSEKGTFEYTVSGNLDGKYYTYFVVNAKYPDGKEITDPYARSAGINGERGMVVNLDATDPEGWNQISYLHTNPRALTVWEMHIADITSSDTWGGSAANQRKYLGVIEEGTTYTENGVTVKTGFDHIKELGVNAVQILPVFDQANDETKYTFNWGYNPLNYNVPEGMYASDPYDGHVRVKELKQVIEAFNKAGITVIMDVVYNHVNGAEGSNFDVLMPNYYYRYNLNGTLSNGSGCGNEVASEYPMVRKFIVDSVKYWTEEYKLGGFRFDLMGLTDIETMSEAEKAVHGVNPDAVIYGEPWTGGTTPLPEDVQAIQKNANLFEGFGQFNDQMRDALIKGGLSGKEEKGWVTGTNSPTADLNRIAEGINGVTWSTNYVIEGADKSVSYVTCHDNYTLYDRVNAAGITDEETVRRMCILANSVVFTSAGTGFMLSGEEFLRTKQGDSNSYMSSDEINMLDYSLKIKNADIFEGYQKLIALKQSNDVLHGLNPQIQVNVLDDGAVIWYDEGDYRVILANSKGSASPVETEGYEIYWTNSGRNLEGNTLQCNSLEVFILKRR